MHFCRLGDVLLGSMVFEGGHPLTVCAMTTRARILVTAGRSMCAPLFEGDHKAEGSWRRYRSRRFESRSAPDSGPSEGHIPQSRID